MKNDEKYMVPRLNLCYFKYDLTLCKLHVKNLDFYIVITRSRSKYATKSEVRYWKGIKNW